MLQSQHVCRQFRSLQRPGRLVASTITPQRPCRKSCNMTTGSHEPGKEWAVLAARRLYTFEAVGQLLGQEAVPADEQRACLAALLRPLVQQLEAAVAPANGAGGGAKVTLTWCQGLDQLLCSCPRAYVRRQRYCLSQPCIGHRHDGPLTRELQLDACLSGLHSDFLSRRQQAQ